MSTLRLRRTCADAKAFVPDFLERSPLFWPLRAAARPFSEMGGWPDVEEYGRAFGASEPVVRFVRSTPQGRRGPGRARRPIDACALYDGRIVHRAEVPTREAHWHDFMNALVWATFPRAKRAIHSRQHAAIARRVEPGMTTLPNARTRELDALALIDEGGVVVFVDPSAGAVDVTSALRMRKAEGVVFGHAIYESLVLEHRAMVARALVVSSSIPSVAHEMVARADAALSAWADCAARSPTGESEAPLVPASLPPVPLDALRPVGSIRSSRLA